MASERNDQSEPAARVPAPVVVLDKIGRSIGLESDRTESVAQQAADCELVLLHIADARRSEVGRAVGHRAELPFAKLLGGSQVDISEIRVAAMGAERSWARRDYSAREVYRL